MLWQRQRQFKNAEENLRRNIPEDELVEDAGLTVEESETAPPISGRRTTMQGHAYA